MCRDYPGWGEADPKAVRELGLLSIESVLVPPAMAVNEEMMKEGEPVKKSEAEAEMLLFVLSETLPIVPESL